MNNIQRVLDENMCVGCSACVYNCPTKALYIEPNEFGFFTSKVDYKKCIECGKCLDICPYFGLDGTEIESTSPYFGWNKDNKIVADSTSGGAFYTIAEKYQGDYKIFGCYADILNKKIYHTSTEKIGLKKLTKSKYVQSDFREALNEIVNFLKAGQKVIFCGTPCQCYGVKMAAPESSDLVLIDFVCHGVPSQKLFFQYLSSEYPNASEVLFRDKSKLGWRKPRFSILAGNKKITKINLLDEYMYLFLSVSENSINPGCSNCQFMTKHISDITLGDYWGYARSEIDKKYIEEGVSLLLVNTERGRQILENTSDMKIEPLSIDKIAYLRNAKNRERRDGSVAFYNYYAKEGYKKTIKKYANNLWVKYLLKKLKIGG